tara:strand:- start:92 stop:742 length:651 start_codon:yes stop_codon:yes gene_type:complete
MNKNQIYSLWPIYIGEFYNPEHQEIKDDLINFFSEYEKKNPQGREGINKENINLYESKYDLHHEKSESLSKLFNFFAKCFLGMSNSTNKKFISEMKEPKPNFDVKINNSWFIKYNTNGSVLPHDHGRCSWCCVYYVQIGEDATNENGSTYFLRPYQRRSPEDFGGKFYSSGGNATFKAVEGKMLIWPNFILHGSNPYKGEKNRIIVSANASVDIRN